MQKVLALAIIMGVLLGHVLVLASSPQVQPSEAEHSTIIVPDDFRTIQQAVNSAYPGDTILVRAGTYEENILVNRSVSLVGESPETTIVDGNHWGSVMTLLSDNITVTGFTLQNSGASWADSGIQIDHVGNCNVSGNDIATNQFGVWAESSTGNVISGNRFTDDGYGVGLYNFSNGNSILDNNVTESAHAGILLAPCEGVDISGNDLTNNEFSVELVSSSNNTIRENNVTGSSHAVALRESSDANEVTENNIENNGWGLEMTTSANNTIYHNNFIHNAPQVFLYEQNYSNTWDTGYPGGGNYWSDLNATDLHSGPYQNETGSDGIADAPLIINGCNEDHYPLMGEFYDFPVNLSHPTASISHVDAVSNITVSSLDYLTWPNSSNPQIQRGQQVILISINPSEEENQTTCFCLLMIPKTVLNTSTYRVLADWNPVNAVQLQTTNTTDYVYFTFSNSTHEIAVTIPEFAFPFALALVIVTTSALSIKKRIRPSKLDPDTPRNHQSHEE